MERTQTIDFRQTREVREIVNTTFSFLRLNFLKLGKSIIYIAGPLLLIAAIRFAGTDNLALQLDGAALSADLFGELFLMALLAGLAMLAATVVINEYVALYVQRGNNSFEVGDVLRATISHLWKYILATLAIFFSMVMLYAAVIVMAASVHPVLLAGLLLIGYLMIAFVLTFIVIPVEGLGALAAIVRSKELVAGNWWQTLSLWMLTYFIELALTMVVYIPFFTVILIIEINTPGAAGQSGQSENSSMHLAAATISFVVIFAAFLLHSIQTIALSLHYFNLVERKEGRGLLREIEQIGTGEA